MNFVPFPRHYVFFVYSYNRYVMVYQNFGNRAIAINTSQYGNDARFIRRSCIPNCFVSFYIIISFLLATIFQLAFILLVGPFCSLQQTAYYHSYHTGIDAGS